MTNPQPAQPSSFVSAFNSASDGRDQRRTGGSPRITLRLAEDELVRLTDMVGSTPISAYVRGRLFGEAVAPRKRQQHPPVEDQQALAQVPGLLGQSRIASNLNQIAYHANCGSLVMDDETEQEIKIACAGLRGLGSS